MLASIRIVFGLILIVSGVFLIRWIWKPGARWQFAGYKLLLGIHNIAVGVLCILGAFRG